MGLGLSVEMEAFGRALILMFCGVGSSLVVQSPGVESPASGVQA